MDKLGLGLDVLRARRPSLIYCAISGYGLTGPLGGGGGFASGGPVSSGARRPRGNPGARSVKPRGDRCPERPTGRVRSDNTRRAACRSPEPPVIERDSPMSTNRRTFIQSSLALGAAVTGSRAAFAQQYPTKPVKLIVPFATGGGSDFIGRFMAQRLSQSLGQPIVVENRPGAGSVIGIDMVVQSPADGYTLGLIASSYTVTPSLYKLKFDPVADITPIVQFSQGPMLVVVNPSVPAKDLKELIALAKARPGALNYASAGQGSITHLATVLFEQMAGVKLTHVPYKGTGPALTDTMGGQTQLFFASTATSLPHVQSGKLRAIAVTTAKRMPALPNVPTIAESGVPGYDVPLWHGLIGPKGVPRPIVDRYVAESGKTLALKETAEHLMNDGVAPANGSTPEQFRAQISREIAQWHDVVAKAGVKIE
jgi:tripartite-type tricarboxylate transporter receptor subunit TctC